MSHTLTEAPLPYPASVECPNDGDDLNQASIEPALQALTNRTALAHAQLSGALPCFGPSPLDCQAGIISTGNISCNGNLLANSGFICSSAATFHGAETHNNACTFENTIVANGAINHSGALNGNVGHFAYVDAVDMLVSNEIVGKVRRRLRYQRITTDANQTLTVASLDHVSCGNVLTAQRTWDLVTTGLVAGDSCEFVNRSNQNVLLKVGASTIFTLVAASFDHRITLIWNGSSFDVG